MADPLCLLYQVSLIIQLGCISFQQLLQTGILQLDSDLSTVIILEIGHSEGAGCQFAATAES